MNPETASQHEIDSFVESVLGPGSATRDPVALLGLQQTGAEPSQVRTALALRLHQLDSSPHASHPIAADLRLALHVAAAQLQDPTYRQHPPTESPPAAPARPDRQTDLSTLDDDTESADIFADHHQPRPVLRTAVVMASVAGLLVTSLLVVMLVFDNRAAQAPRQIAEQSGARTDNPADPEPVDPSPGPKDPDRAAPDPDQIDRAIDLAGTHFPDKPATARGEFLRALDVAHRHWHRLTPARLRAVENATERYLIAAGEYASAEAAIAINDIARPATADAATDPETLVTAPTFAAGMLNRIDRLSRTHPELAPPIHDNLRAIFQTTRPTTERTFEAGARIMLSRLPPIILPADHDRSASPRSPEQTARMVGTWTGCARQVAGTDDALFDQLVVDAAEQFLVVSPDPDAHAQTYEALSILFDALTWREDSPAYRRILEWFRDDRVSDADVRILTSQLLVSGAPGVDSAMVLPAGARADRRLRLRTLYARAWDMPESSAALEVVGRWAQAAREHLGTPPASEYPEDILASAVRSARLTQAAVLLWRGQAGPAADIIELPDADTADNALTSAVGSSKPERAEDGRWALSFAQARRSATGRTEALESMPSQVPSPIGSVDAETLAEAAIFGSPIRVRRLAQSTLIDYYADDLYMINAVLELLPRAPKVPTVARTIEAVARETLPSYKDPDWEFQARRALVERLLEALVVNTPSEAPINTLSRHLADAYADIAQTGTPDPDAPAREVVRAARASAEQWLDSLESISVPDTFLVRVETLRRRHDARVAASKGPVQRFAAHQTSIAEAMALRTAVERPSKRDVIQNLESELRRQRRDAGHVFEQIRHTQDAILELWLLRIGDDL